MIFLSLLLLVAFNIFKEKNIENLMTALSRMHEKPLTSNTMFLMKMLFNMKMDKHKGMAEHLNEFNTIVC